jgi:hypothetical protein
MARPASGTNLTIAELQRVLNQKQSELNKLHRQRENLQRKMDLIDRQIERVGGDGGGPGMRAGGGGGRRPRNEHSLLDTIEAVLRGGGGKPMKVQEILDGVLASGYRSGSANFRGIINQTLIKDKRFGQVQRGVYELKSGGGESKKKSSGKSAAA